MEDLILLGTRECDCKIQQLSYKGIAKKNEFHFTEVLFLKTNVKNKRLSLNEVETVFVLPQGTVSFNQPVLYNKLKWNRACIILVSQASAKTQFSMETRQKWSNTAKKR